MSDILSGRQVMAKIRSDGAWTGSWLAAYASGASIPEGIVRTRPGMHCAACGHAFYEGELGHANPVSDSVTFNNGTSLLGRSSDPFCSACIATWGKQYLLNLSKCVVSEQGVFNFASNENLSWFLLNPPQPPFVMVFSLAKQQHTYWRTPVARSQEVFPIRVGSHVATIRRSLLAQAHQLGLQALADASAWAAERAQAGAQAGTRKRRGLAPRGHGPSKHPYARLDRELIASEHGALKSDVQKYLASGQSPRHYNILAELNELELWALAAVANTAPKKALIAMPDPILRPKPG